MEYGIENLVTIARRDNNPIRSYLYVNPLQGKHIPVEPDKPLKLFGKMAEMLDEKYPAERLLLIGFAETATAIGAGIAVRSDAVKYCMQTTREVYPCTNYLFFTEAHSHAAQQSLITDGLEKALADVDRVVFAEDEVTTGNTICKLIAALRKKYPAINMKFGIISILNSMNEDRIRELEENGVQCLYICRIPFGYGAKDFDGIAFGDLKSAFCGKEPQIYGMNTEAPNFRIIREKRSYADAVLKYADQILSHIRIDSAWKKVLVLGVEEFMYPPLLTADKLRRESPFLKVMFHATTRSPILTSPEKEYPLHSRREIASLYDRQRRTYIYNLDNYDAVVLLSDACFSSEAAKSTLDAIKSTGCSEIYIFGRDGNDEEQL